MGDLSISPPNLTDGQAQAPFCLCPWHFSRMGVVFHLWLHRNLNPDLSAHHLLLRAILASKQERMESNHCPSSKIAYDGIRPRSQSQNTSGKKKIFKNNCLENTSGLYLLSISMCYAPKRHRIFTPLYNEAEWCSRSVFSFREAQVRIQNPCRQKSLFLFRKEPAPRQNTFHQ